MGKMIISKPIKYRVGEISDICSECEWDWCGGHCDCSGGSDCDCDCSCIGPSD